MTIESLLVFVIVLAFIGLIVGAVARVVVPGNAPMGIGATIGAGLVGAFVGGFLGRLLFGPHLTSLWSFVLAVLVAAAVVWAISRRGSHGYRRRPGVLAYDRGYDDGVIVDDDRSYRRRRFF
jgi:uncharacterized membrane protein YeaQ/YmgE (transglycosylase-associated protein family)